MLEVINKIILDTTTEPFFIEVVNDHLSSRNVILKIDNKRYTVNAEDLIAAIKNALNDNK